jgi:hypothetical protein
MNDADHDAAHMPHWEASIGSAMPLSGGVTHDGAQS